MSALDVIEAEVETGNQPGVEAHVEEGTYRKRRLGVFFWLSVVWLVVLILAALLADVLPLKDPDATFRGVSRDGPGSVHWFGADNIGHDIFSRTIYGARRSLAVAVSATLLGGMVGVAIGLVSGFYRRAVDLSLMAVVNILLAIPGLVLLITLVQFLAPPGVASPSKQTFWATIGLAILVVPGVARITRAQVMVWSDRDFIMASRTLGARNKRIIMREIFPNTVATLVSFAFTIAAVLIVAEAALALLGVGDVSGVSWGLMIQNGRSELERSPHMVLFPALFIFLTVLSINFIGDQVRTLFDVRESGI